MKPKLLKIHDLYKIPIFLLLPLFIFTSLIYFNAAPPKAQAVAECDDEFPDSTGIGRGKVDHPENAEKRQACNKAFAEAVASPNKTKNQICQGLNGGKLEGCNKGYEFSRNVSGDELLRREAESKCNSTIGTSTGGGHAGVTNARAQKAACKEAYFMKKKNPSQSQDAICQGKSDQALAGCKKGVELAEKGYLEEDRPDAQTAARNYCASKYPATRANQNAVEREKRAPCREAYLEGLNTNKNKQQVCGNKNGEQKRICEDSFDSGRQAKNNGFVRPGGGADPDAPGDDTPDCGSGLSLGWIICPIVETVSNINQYIFSNIIQPLMEETPLSAEPGDPLYRTWQSFRFIGNILLIVSMLAIVYSQAKGGD